MPKNPFNDFKTIKNFKKRKTELNGEEKVKTDDLGLEIAWGVLKQFESKENQKLHKLFSLNVDINKLKELQQNRNLSKTINEFCIPFINNKKNKKLYYWSILIAILSRIFFHGIHLLVFTLLAVLSYKVLPLGSITNHELSTREDVYVSFVGILYGLNLLFVLFIYSGFKANKEYRNRTIISISTSNIFLYRRTKILVKKCYWLLNSNNDMQNIEDNKEIIEEITKHFNILINGYFRVFLLGTLFNNTKLENGIKNDFKYKKYKSLYWENIVSYIYCFYINSIALIYLFFSIFIYAGFGYLIYQTFFQ
ncbi:hypothetical protein [Malacoplasma penetrans HF-2]|uniref:Uncharacterized protein n=1 Tax=Malacoplasma penetrans (strain HF-2) TaxID=272633 RepID=Q8EVU4_MALP2|nr:hypothetical protein [Malacoplasma penetrans]BAC44255.1 hypothetical protein [Malacoplasma penetrans HF-2]